VVAKKKVVDKQVVGKAYPLIVLSVWCVFEVQSCGEESACCGGFDMDSGTVAQGPRFQQVFGRRLRWV
jgi:hypothetical protein